MSMDVSRAYMYAPAVGDIYVEICDEAATPTSSDMCWKLRKAMYGTRSAAMCWQKDVTSKLLSIGCKQGKASPCLFRHEERDLAIFIHGDDFVCSGGLADLQWLKDK